MEHQNRRLVLDIFDYSGNKQCTLYDNSYKSSGQASDIYVCTERNGWRELKFIVPSVLEGENGSEHNYRLDYLKADYRIRLIDDDGLDWFLISEPKVTHQAFSKNVSVTAGHISQLLKTKNLGLEFSDEEGNNVGTAKQLLQTIQDGTGWTAGYVSTFYEKDETTEKVRTMKASSKTGAFKQITAMCDLFDAKPVFHGDGRVVDIVPMNPFSKPQNGDLPDVTKADGVIEQNYGTNVSSITRTLNTENIVTKLFAYGSYGDKTSGYCGIDEGFHKEYRFTLTEDVPAGKPCCFHPDGYQPKQFVSSVMLPAGSTLVWSALDPASMSYVWHEQSESAYLVTDCDLIVYINDMFEVITNNEHILTGTPMASAEVEILDRQNWASYLMDFSYYQNVGLMSDDMQQQLGKYQRHGLEQLESSYNASVDYVNTEFKLSEIIGNINFCKLNISKVAASVPYHQLVLDSESPIAYRTDYSIKQRKRFTWTPAKEIDDRGDSTNRTASVIYVIHDTFPVTWDKIYIKAFDENKTDPQDGDEQVNIRTITTWSSSAKCDLIPSREGDSYYLLEMDNINGLLGAAESSDEAKLSSIKALTTVVTNEHPVYFIDALDPLPSVDAIDVNGYAWAWKYSFGNPSESQLYFYFGILDGENVVTPSTSAYANKWAPVFFNATPPPRTDETPAYWYNWSSLSGYTKATLYLWKDNDWVPATNKELDGNWNIDPSDEIDINKTTPYDLEDIWATFAAVYDSCKERDSLYSGYRNFYTLEITDASLSEIYPITENSDLAHPTELDAGNYYFVDPYGDYRIFTTKMNLGIGSKQQYDAFNDWIIQTDQHGTTTTIEVKKRPYDTVMYNGDVPNVLIIEKEHYTLLPSIVPSGDTHGIVEFISSFRQQADLAYGEKLAEYLAAQEAVKKLELETAEILGDIYREGWWQKNDYVDGDEDKLYSDAIDNQKEISQPEATYNINFLDRYGANENMEYAAEDILASTPHPDIKVMSAVHLIDVDISVNLWAYFDKINKCYDKPWQTSAAINTKLSTITQHSFTDVQTHIANVANELKGKTTIYDRAGLITTDGTQPTERLEGAIDAAKLKIFSSGSNWYTDEKGNMMFISSDNMSAMTLSGNGFAVANSKDEWGNWNWRTFGTGNGFTADEIVSGFLSADRIQANSISSSKLDENTQLALGWVQGSMIRLEDDAITSTVANALETGSSNEAQAFRASLVKQTSDAVSVTFEDRFSNLENDVASAKTITDEASNWFKFSSQGFEIRGMNQDGTQSSMYTQQTHQEYSFYVDGAEQTSISGNGMVTDQVEVVSALRQGNLVGLIDEENNITWIYSKK